MKRLNSFKHRVLFIMACAAILIVTVLAIVGPGYNKTRYTSYTPPETTQSYTRSDEEKASLQADFEKNLESKAVKIEKDLTGSKLFAVAVTGLSKTADLGKRILRGDYINGYEVKEDSVLVPVPQGFEAAVVKRIVDGDTIFCQIIGSNNPASDIYEMSEDELSSFFPYIRFYGVDTKESKTGAITGYADEASGAEKTAVEYTKDLIKEGQIVWLSAAAEDKDSFGRYVRMIWLEEPEAGDTENTDAIAQKTAQACLLLDGMAEAMFPDGNEKYSGLFSSFQSKAMQDMKGLWEIVDDKRD